jgi:asparagine synthase (glutamine-hydrolysing)
MCGIAGLVGSGAADHVDRVAAMIEALHHRGPDDHGLAVFDGAVLGTARLSVIDPDGGHQPLLGAEGSTALVCNGEIYGHRRIRERFAGYPFRSGSDCEVVLPLYAEHGPDLLAQLPGTFALGLWDDRAETLLLARDRFGERPLYVAETSDGLLLFASESRALFASGLIEASPDDEMVAQMLRQGYVPSGRSVWGAVRALGHAERLRRGPDGVCHVERWWSPPPVRDELTDGEAAEWLRGELDRAVHDQLEADVPIGAFLSGGVDSSTIAALAARHHPDLHAFTFDMPGQSELGLARETAAMHGITLHVCRANTTDMAGQIVEAATRWDEPFGDSSSVPTNQLCRFARERVTTVLTGDGADELLGGYAVWARDCLVDDDDHGDGTPERATTRPVGPSRASGLRGLLRRAGRGNPSGVAAPEHPSPAPSGSSVARRYASFRQIFSADELHSLGLPPLDGSHVDVSALRHGDVNDISRFDLDHYLPGDILVKTDRASMSHGLEVRSPFLDVRVAEGCLALPARHKIDATHEKLVLRRAFSTLWPDQVRDRPKQGFGAPMAEWLDLPDVRDLTHAHLVEATSPLFDLVDADAVRPFVRTDDQRTWNLLMLSLWWGDARRWSRPR